MDQNSKEERPTLFLLILQIYSHQTPMGQTQSQWIKSQNVYIYCGLSTLEAISDRTTKAQNTGDTSCLMATIPSAAWTGRADCHIYVYDARPNAPDLTHSPARGPPATTHLENGRFTAPNRGGLPPGELVVPGRTALREFDLDRYGNFGTASRTGDQLAGHEMLQNAWLREHGHIKTRGTGSLSRDNPAVALGDAMHSRVGLEQRKLGLFDRSKLRVMGPQENISLNAQAMRNAGIPEHVIQSLQKEALHHATGLSN